MTQKTTENDDWPSIVEEFKPTAKSRLKCLAESDLERFNDSIVGKSAITDQKLLTWSEHITICKDCTQKLQELPNVGNWRLEQGISRRTALEDEMIAMRYDAMY